MIKASYDSTSQQMFSEMEGTRYQIVTELAYIVKHVIDRITTEGEGCVGVSSVEARESVLTLFNFSLQSLEEGDDE